MGLFKKKVVKKTPKPDRFIGNLPHKLLKKFWKVYGDTELEKTNNLLRKYLTWEIIGEVFPETKKKNLAQDISLPSTEWNHFRLKVDYDNIQIVGIYETFPGVFLEDEKEETPR